MKKLVLLAVVLAISLPSYGEVLVYKFTASIKMIEYNDPNRTTSPKTSTTEKISAFVVFAIDSNTPLNVISTAPGNRPTAILYGKSKTAGKWKKIIGNDSADSSVLIQTAESQVLGIQTFNTYTVTSNNQKRSEVKFTFSDEPNGPQPFQLIIDGRGKATKTGPDMFTHTIELPWNLSGITSMTSGDTGSATFVTGQATSGKLKIDFPRINTAENEHLTTAQMISRINDSDTLAGYSDLGTAPIPVP